MLSAVLLAVLLTDDPKPAEPAEKPPVEDAGLLFADENLRTVIREIMEQKSRPSEIIKKDDLRTIYFLRAPKRGITSLAGLEHCPNLSLVDLSGNAIEDASPLAGAARLQSLNLSGNKLTSTDPLASLAKLQYVDLSGNALTALDGLSSLPNLRSVLISGNAISSLDPLGKCESIHSLWAADNRLTSLDPLKELPFLDTLDVSGNAITSLDPLAGNDRLGLLLLGGNEIGSLKPILDTATKSTMFLKIDLDAKQADALPDQIAALKAASVRISVPETPAN